MKTSSKLATVIMALTLAGCDMTKESIPGLAHNDNGKVAELESQLLVLKKQTEADEKLGQYALNMMSMAGAKKALSDAMQLILARSIVRVANDIFETVEEKQGFVAVLAIESAFNQFAQSPTGPKGYGQLARASFHEAVQDCGLKNAKDDDVWETELNLYAAACYFKKMLVASGNDPFVAIVAYNQGPNSDAAKQYAKYGTMENVEALKYVARFNFLTRKVTDEKPKAVPVKTDLPVETAPKVK